MGLFNRKKKPWEYRTSSEKMYSIMEDFPKDNNVLKRVIKDESDMDVKLAALLAYSMNNKFNDVEDILKFLVFDVGLSADESATLLSHFADRIKEFKDEK